MSQRDVIQIIGDDFNASRGINDNNINSVTGAFKNSHGNDRGETFRNFVAMNKLCSTATFCKKNKI